MPDSKVPNPRAAQSFALLNEIGIINQLATARFESLLPEGLNTPQFSVLNNFVRLGGTRTPAQLADAFQVTRGAMTNTLKRLEAKGFVKIRKDAKDLRSKEVSITAKGRRIREVAIAATFPELQKLLPVIGEKELPELLAKLQLLRQWLDENR